MSIADFLSNVGNGLATAGRVAGAVAGPVVQSLAEEESGQAPEIQAERRRQKMALQQSSLASDVNDLQNQLAMGIKYGTLNDDQQQQYKKAIAQKYMDAISQAAAPGGNLTERLHAAVHPGGAPHQPYTPTLQNAVPEGGTQKRDVDLAVEAANAKKGVRPVPGVRPFLNESDGQYYQPMYDAHGGIVNQVVDDYKPPKRFQQKAVNSPSHGGVILANYDPTSGETSYNGETLNDLKPYTKPANPQMKTGVSGGKQKYAYYNMDEHTWIDSNTGIPDPKFVPNAPFSATGLFGLDVAYDNEGNGHAALLNRRTGQMTPAPLGLVAPAQAKNIETARNDAIASKARLSIMLDNEKPALNGDQQAQISLLMNHIGMTIGAQKGTRVNQATIRDAENSTPWAQQIYAKWGHADPQTGDWIYDGYKTGTNLTPEQIEQMVGLAKVVRDVKYQQLKDTAAAQGVNITIPEFQDKPSATGANTTKVGSILPKTGASAAGETVKMKAPNGAVKDIPAGQVDHYKQLGATVVQ